jgi:signal transduction histidine kinase
MESEHIRVLAVEDNPGDARLIEEMLAESGEASFDLVRVDRMSAAAEHLAAGGIDLVLLDLSLPDVRGLYALMAVAKQAAEMPVVVLTGTDDEALAVAAAQLGVEEYLVKRDLESTRLRRSIRCALERYRMKAALKQRVTELAKSERRFRKLINANADAVIVTDRDGRVQFANPVAEALFECKPRNLQGTRLECPLVAGETTEFSIARNSGEQVVLEMRVVETEWEGEPAYLATLRDVTSRKRSEESLSERTMQLKRANEDLLRRNGELDEFTYAASHDLQEPLRKLVAFCKLLSEDVGDDLPARARTDLEHIIYATGRMQTFLQDLLSLSRAGSNGLAHEEISLDECADMAIDALSVTIQETGAEIVRDKLPAVWGDRTRLIELYQNLIGNAIKFRRDAKPRLRLTVEKQDGRLVLGVKDNGIGIKPEYASQIFAPFKRLHGAGEYPGTGIGLAICRKVVERHGGEIWVESEPGRGSHFRFTLDGNRRENEEPA